MGKGRECVCACLEVSLVSCFIPFCSKCRQVWSRQASEANDYACLDAAIGLRCFLCWVIMMLWAGGFITPFGCVLAPCLRCFAFISHSTRWPVRQWVVAVQCSGIKSTHSDSPRHSHMASHATFWASSVTELTLLSWCVCCSVGCAQRNVGRSMLWHTTLAPMQRLPYGMQQAVAWVCQWRAHS